MSNLRGRREAVFRFFPRSVRAASSAVEMRPSRTVLDYGSRLRSTLRSNRTAGILERRRRRARRSRPCARTERVDFRTATGRKRWQPAPMAPPLVETVGLPAYTDRYVSGDGKRDPGSRPGRGMSATWRAVMLGRHPRKGVGLRVNDGTECLAAVASYRSVRPEEGLTGAKRSRRPVSKGMRWHGAAMLRDATSTSLSGSSARTGNWDSSGSAAATTGAEPAFPHPHSTVTDFARLRG
jgi:hypothetical protein